MRFLICLLMIGLILVDCEFAIAVEDDATAAKVAIESAVLVQQVQQSQGSKSCQCAVCDCVVCDGIACCPSVETDYGKAYAKAVKENKPLIVGVQCAPPSGDWISCKVNKLEGVDIPCIVVSSPKGGYLYWQGVLSAAASADRVKGTIPTIPPIPATAQGEPYAGAPQSIPQYYSAPQYYAAPQFQGFSSGRFGGGFVGCSGGG
jgi:hypothetical protein